MSDTSKESYWLDNVDMRTENAKLRADVAALRKQAEAAAAGPSDAEIETWRVMWAKRIRVGLEMGEDDALLAEAVAMMRRASAAPAQGDAVLARDLELTEKTLERVCEERKQMEVRAKEWELKVHRQKHGIHKLELAIKHYKQERVDILREKHAAILAIKTERDAALAAAPKPEPNASVDELQVALDEWREHYGRVALGGSYESKLACVIEALARRAGAR